MLTVANFNMHAGVDGWGRPFDFVSACRQIDADVLVHEDTWTSTPGPTPGMARARAGAGAARAANRRSPAPSAYQVVECTLAEGRRSRPDPKATARWQLAPGLRQRAATPLLRPAPRCLHTCESPRHRYVEGEPGNWGIAVLVRHGIAIEASRILHLPTLARDRVRRAAIVVDLTVDGVALSVVGTHMSHIVYGSHRHYWALQALLRTEARPDAALLGDMNLWGPPVRAYMRGWHRGVRGRTWPSWNPHSQIDHILVRGRVRASGEVLPDAGSDHLPVRASLTFR